MIKFICGCFTCNNMIGDKWEPYIKLVKKEKEKNKETVDIALDKYILILMMVKKLKKVLKGHVLDRLKGKIPKY